MSVEFRQRRPAEYARILWRRKLLIILPAIAISFAVAIVVWRLPNVYQSTTLLIVQPSSMVQGFLPKLSDSELNFRINTISQNVFSRTSLEPLINKYDLYSAERRRGTPMEVLVARMQTQDTQIALNRTNEATNGFSLSFRAADPRLAQAVTAELAGKYVTAQIEEARAIADQNLAFIEGELKKAKDELDAVERQRLDFLRSNLDHLPATSGSLVQQLNGAYEQQKALMAEIGRMRDQKTLLGLQLGEIEKQSEKAVDDAIENLTDPKTTSAWATLTGRESALDAEIVNMLTRLTKKNPDVIAKQQELDAVKRDKQALLDEWEAKKEEKRKKLADYKDPRIFSLKLNLQALDGELARQQKFLDQTTASIADLQRRVGGIPGTEVNLGAIDREYTMKKTVHDELLNKKNQVSLEVAALTSAQGDKISVVDPANLPQNPVAPKRAQLLILGLAFGLGVGLFCAVGVEVPRLLTVQNIEDARHYTHLPVLISVPELLTAREIRRRRARRLLLTAAGIAVTVVSIPALALLLRFTRVLERIAS